MQVGHSKYPLLLSCGVITVNSLLKVGVVVVCRRQQGQRGGVVGEGGGPRPAGEDPQQQEH